jgi:hypothetical protein
MTKPLKPDEIRKYSRESFDRAYEAYNNGKVMNACFGIGAVLMQMVAEVAIQLAELNNNIVKITEVNYGVEDSSKTVPGDRQR